MRLCGKKFFAPLREKNRQMKITDYFGPVELMKNKLYVTIPEKYALGPEIENCTKNFSENRGKNPDAVIIGVPVENGNYQKGGNHAPDKIREVLYGLAPFGKNLHVADLGNLRPATTLKGTFLALRDAVEYLHEKKIVTIVIGGSQDLTAGMCEAFRNNRFFRLSVVDALPDIKKGSEPFNATNYLTRLFKTLPNLFQFNLIGYQNHLVGEKLLKKIAGLGEHLRLGQLRDDISKAEIVLRSTHALSFDIGAVKYAEAPSSRQKNPNGLSGEEACQIARYAGLSPDMELFGLFETTAGKDENHLAIRLAAEIIWYFLEGLALRSPAGNRTVYKVKVEGLDQPVIFFHEKESDRWWFEVRSVSGETMEIACTEKEYRQAADNEIPDRWLKFLQKGDRAEN